MAAFTGEKGSGAAIEMADMRIKTDTTFLCVKRVELGTETVGWEVQAAVTTPSCMMAGYERGAVRTSGEMRKRIADFVAHRAHRLELLLPQEGWLGFQRSRGGRLTVRYCLGGLSAGAWLEGEIQLAGGPAAACCRELGGLL